MQTPHGRWITRPFELDADERFTLVETDDGLSLALFPAPDTEDATDQIDRDEALETFHSTLLDSDDSE